MGINLKCRHSWKAQSFTYNGDDVTFRCSKCHEVKTRSMNAAEKYFNKRSNIVEGIKNKHDNIHEIYHDFLKKCIEYKDSSGAILFGYELICHIEKWAKKFPTVDIISCDDDYHMGSIIVVIPHENSEEYWGTSLVFIPQNHKQPATIFLYPGHAQEMLNVLKKVVKLGKDNSIFARLNMTK